MIKYLVSPSRRLWMLLLTWIIGVVITMFASGAIMRLGSDANVTAMARISIVIQDIFMLILPAIATAMIVTRQSAHMLALTTSPGISRSIIALIVMVISAPAMNVVIEANASVTFPESLKGLEEALRQMEETAASGVDLVLGAHSVPNLVLSILIVGFLAGLSEELFFRGALQRILGSFKINKHAAIWIAACVFSLIHFQFFGFLPRLLLGAYFGYLLLWSGSVWLPVIVHAFNNTLYIILKYYTGSGDLQPAEPDMKYVFVGISIVATVVGLQVLYRQRVNPKK